MEARLRRLPLRLARIDPPEHRGPMLVHVLCVLEVLGRDLNNRTVRYQDSVVVRVLTSKGILNAVNNVVHGRIARGEWNTGATPQEWKVISYIPANGLEHF